MARRRDPEAQKARRAAAEASDVLEAAARSLSGAPRSRKSLEERLITAGYPEEHVRTAVARLVEIGLIDDERFGQALLDSRDRSRQRGDRALLQELKRRGIDDELAQRLLAQRAAGEAQSTEPVWGATLRVVEEHAHQIREAAVILMGMLLHVTEDGVIVAICVSVPLPGVHCVAEALDVVLQD